MSQVIIELAQPFVDECDGSRESLEQIISATVLAWNFAVVHDLGEGDLLESVAGDFADDPRFVAEFTSSELYHYVSVTRRQRYPQLNRFILDIYFQRESYEKGSIYFEVAYTQI